MTDVLRPVAPQERIGALDLLRGWAMFGVLWSNIYGYGRYQPDSALDRALKWTHYWLLQDRFATLLVLLFGIGFGIQLTRANTLGRDLRNTYYRRSAALLAIGIVHGTLIWEGDILTIYALTAFALVMFRTASTRKVIVVGAVLWIAGPIIVQDLMFLSGLRFMAPWFGDLTPIYARGTWLGIEHVRVAVYMDRLGRFGLGGYVRNLAAFLIGLWCIKSGYLRRLVDEPRGGRAASAYFDRWLRRAGWRSRLTSRSRSCARCCSTATALAGTADLVLLA